MEGESQGIETNELRLEDFKFITQLAYDRWGLRISDSNRVLVHNRLYGLARELKLGGVDALLKRIFAAKADDSLLDLFDALSTNETSFFRHPDHFVWLKKFLLKPESNQRPIRIWSAGCSLGCEPYSIAIALDELSSTHSVEGKVLATDLSKSMLEKAAEGVYAPKYTQELDPKLLSQNFEVFSQDSLGLRKIKPAIRKYVSFGLLNLLGDWKLKGDFDVIFCRNVMIYFDGPTREKLIDRFADVLRPGGVLILGNAESMTRPNPKLQREGSIGLIKK